MLGIRLSAGGTIAVATRFHRASGVLSCTLALVLIASSAHAADPNRPIEIGSTALGDPLLTQDGKQLSDAELERLLTEQELTQVRTLNGLSLTMAALGGATLGLALAEAEPIDGETLLGFRPAQTWTMVGVGAGLLTVAFPMAYRSGDIVEGAGRRHNERLSGGKVESSDYERGWFVRTAFAGGQLSMEENVVGASNDDLSFSGLSGSYEWLLGHHVAAGVVLGGGVLAASQFGPDVSNGSEELDGSGVAVHLTSPLVFAQYYPLRDLGLYAQLLAGYAADVGERDEQVVQSDTSGYLLSLGVGWDIAVAPSAGIGVFARGLYASLESEVEVTGIGASTTLPLTHSWQGLMGGLSVTYY